MGAGPVGIRYALILVSARSFVPGEAIAVVPLGVLDYFDEGLYIRPHLHLLRPMSHISGVETHIFQDC